MGSFGRTSAYDFDLDSPWSASYWERKAIVDFEHDHSQDDWDRWNQHALHGTEEHEPERHALEPVHARRRQGGAPEMGRILPGEINRGRTPSWGNEPEWGRDTYSDGDREFEVEPREHQRPISDPRRHGGRRQAWMGGTISSYGEVGSDPELGAVRGFHSGAYPEGHRTSSRAAFRRDWEESVPEGLPEKRRPTASSEGSHSHGENFPRRSERSSGSPSRRKQAEQLAGEPGVRNQSGQRGRHDASRHTLAGAETGLPRRSLSRRSESNTQPAQARMEAVSRVRSSPKAGAQRPRAGISGRSRSGVSKTGWVGWGPDIANGSHHKVAGWDWDNHLNAYVAKSSTRQFTCDCGQKHPVPGYSNCKCGKIWNSYVIGTGGDRHEAAAEKFLCREIPRRDGVIVANRRTASGTFGDLNEGDEISFSVTNPRGHSVPGDYRKRVHKVEENKSGNTRNITYETLSAPGGNFSNPGDKYTIRHRHTTSIPAHWSVKRPKQALTLSDLRSGGRGYDLEDEVEDTTPWPSDHHPSAGDATMRPAPADWHSRSQDGKWTSGGAPSAHKFKKRSP